MPTLYFVVGPEMNTMQRSILLSSWVFRTNSNLICNTLVRSLLVTQTRPDDQHHVLRLPSEGKYFNILRVPSIQFPPHTSDSQLNRFPSLHLSRLPSFLKYRSIIPVIHRTIMTTLSHPSIKGR
jgi:hypothetical protein